MSTDGRNYEEVLHRLSFHRPRDCVEVGVGPIVSQCCAAVGCRFGYALFATRQAAWLSSKVSRKSVPKSDITRIPGQHSQLILSCAGSANGRN
jgi:hypothetical protein